MLNVEDLPDEIADALAQPPVRARAVCRLPAALRARRFHVEREAALRLGLSRAALWQARPLARRCIRSAPLRNAAVLRVRRAARCLDELGVERSADGRRAFEMTRLTQSSTRCSSAIPRVRTWPSRTGEWLYGVARSMTNRAIRDLSAFFVLLFAMLAIRQVYVQLVAAPSIARAPANPRHALLDASRGRILATDGTVLAQTVGGKRALSARRAARADGRLRIGTLRHERHRAQPSTAR